MSIIYREQGGSSAKPRFNTPSCVVDGAGNIFVGIAQVAGAGSAYRKNVLVLKVEPSGQVYETDERAVEGGLVDGVGLVQSGNLLHVFAGAHIGDPLAVLEHYTLDVCVPYPEGQHIGMEGAHMPEEGEPIVNGPTKEEIAAEVIAQLKAEMGGELRDVLETKAKDAIRELNMHSESMQTRGVDQWVRDRMYQCLVENGLITP